MNDCIVISSTANVLCLCRLCGSETVSLDTPINIFDTNGIALKIKSKIENCLSLYVSETDYLPKILCTECVDNLIKFNEFKIKSNKIALHLRELLEKQKNTSNNSESSKKSNNKQDISFISECPQVKSIGQTLTNKNNDSIVPIPLSLLANIQNPQDKKKQTVFQCNICKKLFSTHEKSVDHINTVHKNNVDNKIQIDNSENCMTKSNDEILKEYKCNHCPLVFNTKKKMYSHMRRHRDKKYNCTLCDMKFRCKSSLKTHMKYHNKEYDHVCSFCGKCIMGKTNLDVHVRAVHTKEFPFQCTKCDKKFPAKGQLKLHDQVVHNDVCNFTCDICNKSFKTKSYVRMHKKVHLPKETRKRFICNVCGISLCSKNVLKRHIFGHTGELKYDCTLCNNKYKDKKGLNVHLLTHTGERNHICEVCGKAFALNSNLVDHRRIHTGERPFKCDACEKTFTQKSALNRHKKSCLIEQK